MRKGLVLSCVIFFSCFSFPYLCAQTDGKEGIINKPDTIVYFAPEFYKPIPDTSRDTLFRFECYDKRDSVIGKVSDFEQVYYLSVFKNYIDSFHTYVDAKGVKQFLPISKIVKRYDRIGKCRWMCISYPGNHYMDLKGNPDSIIRVDTIRTNINGKLITEIYQYYKVEEINN